MAYLGLSRDEMFRLATDVPLRTDVVAFHRYCREVNDFRAMLDDVESTIPEPFIEAIGGRGGKGGKHEGGMHLDQRINELAKWLNRLKFQISVEASSISTPDAELAAAQEAFANDGETMFKAGTPLHRFGQECSQSLAKCGVAIVRQHPRADYYANIPERIFTDADGAGMEPNKIDRRFRRDGDDRDPRSFAFREELSVFQNRRRQYTDQSLLTDLWLKECVPPESFAWVENVTGGFDAVVETRRRSLGELAELFGVEAAAQIFGLWDFGRGVRPDDTSTWPAISLETREVWTADQGMLFGFESSVQSSGRTPHSRDSKSEGLLFDTWSNQQSRVPYSIRASGPMPWVSDLDLMVRLTGERNHWATMKYAQARLAVFRRPQLVTPADPDFGGIEPQTLDFKPGQLPNPPDGAKWEEDPFTFQPQIFVEYQEIVRQHEMAGAIVAKLMGSEIAEHTAVGTADAIEETAQRPFGDALESIAFGVAEEWAEFFRWLAIYHRDDPVFVHTLQVAPPGKIEPARRIARVLKGRDVVSENITVRAVPQSLINQVALKNMADEGIARGSWDYEHAVEQGWIPEVNDANTMLKRVFASKMRDGMAQNAIEAELESHRLALQGTLPTPQTEETDQFGRAGGGAGQGPINIRNSQVAASTAAGGTAPPSAATGAA